MATANMKLPLIAEGQGQPHVTHNAALDLIDALFPRVVVSASLASPPILAGRADPSAYIVPPGGSGFGAAVPGNVAVWIGGAWVALVPKPGARWFVEDELRGRVFDGARWRVGDVAGALGSSLGLAVAEAAVNLTGASVTVAGLVPNRCILLGVTSWVITAITGATSYSVGNAAGQSQYGSDLGGAAGSQNVGVIGPTATYAAGNIVVTAGGGNFTGGRLGLSVAYLQPQGGA